MSLADRDYLRGSDSSPEAWGHARATWVLTGLLVLVWLLPGTTTGRLRLEHDFALVPLHLPERAGALLWYEFLPPQGGPGIALVCLAMLWFLARDVERDERAGAMLWTFFAGALAAGLAAWGIAAVTRHAGALTGAHGGTAALAARWAVRRRGDSLGGVPAALLAGLAIVAPSLARLLDVGDRIALAWIAGAVPGLLLGRLAARGEAVARASLPPPVEPDLPETPNSLDATRRRVDALLGKIQAKGLAALTEEEKAFLARASREFREAGGRE